MRPSKSPPFAADFDRSDALAALAALAAVNCLLTSGPAPRLLIGVEPIAVGLCVAVVARTRMLFPGVAAAVVVVAAEHDRPDLAAADHGVEGEGYVPTQARRRLPAVAGGYSARRSIQYSHTSRSGAS